MPFGLVRSNFVIIDVVGVTKMAFSVRTRHCMMKEIGIAAPESTYESFRSSPSECGP